MKRPPPGKLVLVGVMAVLAGLAQVQAQSVDSFYAGTYSLRSITNIPGVPRPYGGVTIRTNAPNVLLVAGACESTDAKIYQVTVQRGADGHITNFTGTPTVLANAPGMPIDGNPPWTGLSGDWDFGPGGVLFYISPDSSLSQIKPGLLNPSKQVDLFAAGLSFGTVLSVPAGLPGAGRFKLLTRNHQFWSDVPLTSDGTGTYDIGYPTVTVELIGYGLIGAAYVPAGAPKFPKASVVICDTDRVASFEVDANGDPLLASARQFVTGLAAPEGVGRDPVTGDFMFVSVDNLTAGFYLLGTFAAAALPTVNLIAPTNGTRFEAPATFDVHAEATAQGGTIAKVEFYQNTVPFRTITATPYTATVTDLPAGTYAYFAVATDGIGRMATSTVATVTVTNPAPNVPPTVSLTSPTNQATFCACTIIPLVAVAEDGDGEVVSVGFYDGATPLALLSVPPYRWSVTNLAGGAHSLTARATDNRGATRTSAVVNITIPPPPANTLVATLTLRGEFEGCFAGLAGTNYILTRVTNLSFPGPWSQVATRLVTNASPTGVLRFVDPSSTNLPRTYFYRVEQWR